MKSTELSIRGTERSDALPALTVQVGGFQSSGFMEKYNHGYLSKLFVNSSTCHSDKEQSRGGNSL